MFGLFNKIQDPVCKMKVDKKTQYFSEYKNEKYYFCSENCKKSFQEKPEKYVSQKNIPAKKLLSAKYKVSLLNTVTL